MTLARPAANRADLLAAQVTGIGTAGGTMHGREDRCMLFVVWRSPGCLMAADRGEFSSNAPYPQRDLAITSGCTDRQGRTPAEPSSARGDRCARQRKPIPEADENGVVRRAKSATLGSGRLRRVWPRSWYRSNPRCSQSRKGRCAKGRSLIGFHSMGLMPEGTSLTLTLILGFELAGTARGSGRVYRLNSR